MKKLLGLLLGLMLTFSASAQSPTLVYGTNGVVLYPPNQHVGKVTVGVPGMITNGIGDGTVVMVVSNQTIWGSWINTPGYVNSNYVGGVASGLTNYTDSATNAISGMLGGYVPTNRNLTAGSGLLGGGTLDANRSFAIDWATALATNNSAYVRLDGTTVWTGVQNMGGYGVTNGYLKSSTIDTSTRQLYGDWQSVSNFNVLGSLTADTFYARVVTNGTLLVTNQVVLSTPSRTALVSLDEVTGSLSITNAGIIYILGSAVDFGGKVLNNVGNGIVPTDGINLGQLSSGLNGMTNYVNSSVGSASSGITNYAAAQAAAAASSATNFTQSATQGVWSVTQYPLALLTNGTRPMGASLNMGSQAITNTLWLDMGSTNQSVLIGNEVAQVQTFKNDLNSQSVLIGYNVGGSRSYSSGNSGSVLIGWQAGYDSGGASGITAIGWQAAAKIFGPGGTIGWETAVGQNALTSSTNVWGTVAVGSSAMDTAHNSPNAVAIGYNNSRYAVGSIRLVSIGANAGYQALNSSNAIYIGQSTGYYATNAQNSVMIGENAGNKAANSSGSVFIGDGAGYYATIPYQLAIEGNFPYATNSQPLIGGDFNTRTLVFNATNGTYFTGLASGLTPVVSTNLATKGYVDSAIGSITPLYLTATTNIFTNGYYNMVATLVTNNVTLTVNSVTNNQYAFSWLVSPSNYVSQVRNGIAQVDINTFRSGGTALTIKPEIYVKYSDNTEPELFDAGENLSISTTATSYTLGISTTNTIVPSTAKGILLKLKVVSQSGNPNWSVNVGQNYLSALRLSTLASGVVYLAADGSVLPTGTFNWNNQSITNINKITVGGISNVFNGVQTTATNYGVLNLGNGSFEGGAGSFNGTSNGTYLAVNMAPGYIGNFFDYQLGGSARAYLSSNGNLFAANSLLIGSTVSLLSSALNFTGAGSTIIVGNNSSTANSSISLQSGTGTGATVFLKASGTNVFQVTSNYVATTLFGTPHTYSATPASPVRGDVRHLRVIEGTSTNWHIQFFDSANWPSNFVFSSDGNVSSLTIRGTNVFRITSDGLMTNLGTGAGITYP